MESGFLSTFSLIQSEIPLFISGKTTDQAGMSRVLYQAELLRRKNVV
jgi:hypothetical protein